ncbi:GIY-YIG nuclease family protein [Rhizobium sp. BK661]|uniref:GIY-YIG nuclease family protein n=1 Tax=Rhizobium sp. BK661 TaxID=2586991 RepID=UPI003867F54A|nr:hypothetical protein [Rhizobium sp. BK661]
MVHYVYALSAAIEIEPYCGWLKIGHSNNPIKRLAAHRISSAIPLKYGAVWCFKARRTAIEVETALHRTFADRWEHGEWHRLSVPEVVDFVSGFIGQRCLFTCSTSDEMPARPRLAYAEEGEPYSPSDRSAPSYGSLQGSVGLAMEQGSET